MQDSVDTSALNTFDLTVASERLNPIPIVIQPLLSTYGRRFGFPPSSDPTMIRYGRSRRLSPREFETSFLFPGCAPRFVRDMTDRFEGYHPRSEARVVMWLEIRSTPRGWHDGTSQLAGPTAGARPASMSACSWDVSAGSALAFHAVSNTP